MLIIASVKCIQIHIPKTGGTSISSALKSLAYDQPLEVVQKYPKHIKASDLKRQLDEKIWKEYFKFSFIRNPWDLMVSSYYWWLEKAPRWTYFQKDVEQIMSLGNFTNFIKSDYGKKMINEIEGNISDWIFEDGECIVDFVGKFENIHIDFRKILNTIGAGDIKLPHLNRSVNKKAYRDYYTIETKNLVAGRFAKTIELFGYRF